MSKSFNFNDLYEEIKQEQAKSANHKIIKEFYEHWGKPFTQIAGLKNEVEKEPEIPP